MIPNKAKRITLLDGYFIASLVSISLILVVNISLHSLALVYLAILAVLALLAYATTVYDQDGSLRRFWVMGLLSLIPYPFVDYLFEARLKLVASDRRPQGDSHSSLYIPLLALWYLALRPLLPSGFGFNGQRMGGGAGHRALRSHQQHLRGEPLQRHGVLLQYGELWDDWIYPSRLHLCLFVDARLSAQETISGLVLYALTGVSWYLSYYLVLWTVSIFRQ